MNRVITKLLPIIDRITGTQDALEQMVVLIIFGGVLSYLFIFGTPFVIRKLREFYRKHRRAIVYGIKVILIPVVVIAAAPIGAALGACYLTGKWVITLWKW